MQEEKINLIGFNGLDFNITLDYVASTIDKSTRVSVTITRQGEPYLQQIIPLSEGLSLQLNPPTSHLALATLWDEKGFRTKNHYAFLIAMMWAGYGLVMDLVYHNEDEYQQILTALNVESLTPNANAITSPSGEPFKAILIKEAKNWSSRVLLSRLGLMGDYVNLPALSEWLLDFLNPIEDEITSLGTLGVVGRQELTSLWRYSKSILYMDDLWDHPTPKFNPHERAVLESLFLGVPFEAYDSLIK